MTDKIRVIKTDCGVFVSIQDYCNFMHNRGIITDRQRLGIRWTMMTLKVRSLARGLKNGQITSWDFVLIFGTDDFFANWYFFEAEGHALFTKKEKYMEEYYKLCRMMDKVITQGIFDSEVLVDYNPVVTL